MNIVDLGADLPADLQQVSEALAGDNRHLADLALDQSIRTDRGAVGKANDVARIEPVFGEHRCDAFDDGDIGAIRRRWKLVANLAVFAGNTDSQIGKRSADVDADMNFHAIPHVSPRSVAFI